MLAGIIILTLNSARIVYRSIYSESVFVDQIYYTQIHYNVIFSLTPAGVGKSHQHNRDVAECLGMAENAVGAER